MKLTLVVVVLVASLVACGGASAGPAASSTSPSSKASSPTSAPTTSTAVIANCDYIPSADLTLAFYSSGFYAGKPALTSAATDVGCDYKVQGFSVCQLNVFKGAGADGSYNSYKAAAANYGTVSDAAIGDKGYVATKGPDGDNRYAFDIGFEKKTTALVLICAAATSNGAVAPQATAIMTKAAGQI